MALKLTFFMGHEGFVRNFEPAFKELARREHSLRLAWTGGRARALMLSEADSLEALARAVPGLTYARAPRGRDHALVALEDDLATARDYLRFLAPQYGDAQALAARARAQSPPAFARAVDRTLRGRTAGQRALDAALAAAERTLPTSPELDRVLAAERPDAVIVTPLIGLPPRQNVIVRSAQAAGIPVGLAVHSWDNLTNKGRIHAVPDLVLVWNEAQVAEARELHGIGPGGVVATGAHSYDHWFERGPRSSRAEFCARVGLDAASPIVLYVGSSMSIAPDETGFVARWLRAVRAHPATRDVGVIIRPHPGHREQWSGVALDEDRQTMIWPVDAPLAGRQAQDDYYDSIHHSSAIVGINTSALIEGAIQRRPLHTVLDPEFATSQSGTPHFAHLTGDGDSGLLIVARSLQEHVRLLADSIAHGADAERFDRFLSSFVRPHGIDAPAAPRFADAIEALAALRPAVPGDRRTARAVLAPVAARLPERRPAAPIAGPASRSLKTLFFLRSINYDRHFEAVLRELVDRGHRVHVALDVAKKGDSGETSLFDSLRARSAAFTYGLVPPRRAPLWAEFAERVRHGIDYLRYLEPEFAVAGALRERAERRTPHAVLAATRLPGVRSPPGRRALGAILRAIEASIPIDRSLRAFVHEQDPDLVLVSPLVGLGSPQGDYVRAAGEAGVPTALLVASWDNLTNKGVIRDTPDLTVVWNEPQAHEAVGLHGIPRDRIAVTGAHTYDHWFEWRPSSTRAEFCARVGLDADRPFVLYVCSSHFIAPDELSFLERWVAAVRTSPDPLVRDCGILIRPHPANPQPWDRSAIELPGRVVVWPRHGDRPIDAERKADYYDSIHHCRAVVGINTSAQIEAAIQLRPVLTLLAPDFRGSQQGTLHFGHIADPDTGLLSVASDLDEHLAQLADAILSDTATTLRSHRFLEHFVRPLGLAEPTAPQVVDALERCAARRVPARTRSRVQAATAAALSPVVHVGPALRAQTGIGSAPVRSRAVAVGDGTGPLTILLVLDHPGLLIHFDVVIRALTDRGHTVKLAFGRRKFEEAVKVLDPLDRRVMLDEHPARERGDGYQDAARQVRATTDALHYLQPALAGADYARLKWSAHPDVPAAVSRMGPRLAGRATAVRAALAATAAVERALPSTPPIERAISKSGADLVLVSPFVSRPGYQTDYVKSARRLGLPTGLLVASWDNLSSKGRIRTLPDAVLVWNEAQRDEAVALHGVPSSRVVLTGAQPFDRWFDRSPTSTAAEFKREVGLPVDREFVLFVGSTRQELDETAERRYVEAWSEALRRSDAPAVRDLVVLVRPHPTTADLWASAAEVLGDRDDLVVWRREPGPPILDADRDAYFDSIQHATAVLGINSSAMIEAAIAGRPVYTVRLPELYAMQRGLLHYHHLLPENGGFLREATSWDELVAMMTADLRDPVPNRDRRLRFLSSFVRPRGLDEPATPVVVEAIERLGASIPSAPPRSSLRIPVRVALNAASARRRAEARSLRAIAPLAARTQATLRLQERRVLDRAERPDRITAAARPVLIATSDRLARAADAMDRTGRSARRALKARGVRMAKPPKSTAASGKPPKSPKAAKAAKARQKPSGSKPTKPAKTARSRG